MGEVTLCVLALISYFLEAVILFGAPILIVFLMIHYLNDVYKFE